MWDFYHTPSTLEDALEALSDHAPTARIVVGATDLMLELERGSRAQVTRLIDITRIPGLDQISEQEGWIRLGPLVTHNHCAGSRLIHEHAAALAQACWEVGAPQIRNRATIAGNLITASPANDSIPPLMALGAEVTLRSSGGERRVGLRDFYSGVRKTIMQPDEILTEIRFRADPGSRSAFFKLGLRRAQAISVVNAAVMLAFEGEKVVNASITLGSVAPVVVYAEQAQDSLIGKPLSLAAVEHAAELAEKAATPIDDLRGSAGYRRYMVRICVLRALRQLLDSDELARLPDNPIMLWGVHEARPATPLDDSVIHKQGEPIETIINGRAYRFENGQSKSLLRLLRDQAGLMGTKEGCAEGECGACTIFLDGAAVMACLVPAPRAHGAEIVTVEGLAAKGKLHAVQQAFVDEGAVQCGYCTPGFIMSGVKLLEEVPAPTQEAIKEAFTGNLCRCTGYYKILTAMEKAAVMTKA